MDYKRKNNSTKQKILYPYLNGFLNCILFFYLMIMTIFLFGYVIFYLINYTRYIYNNPEISNKVVEEILHTKGNSVHDEFNLKMQISILIFVSIMFILGNLLYFQKYKKNCCTYFHRIFLISLMVYFCYHTKSYINQLNNYIKLLQTQIVNESITKVISNMIKLINFQKKALNITILLILLKCFYIILLFLDIDNKNENKNKKNLSKQLIELEDV